jgi:hypothetical protein
VTRSRPRAVDFPNPGRGAPGGTGGPPHVSRWIRGASCHPRRPAVARSAAGRRRWHARSRSRGCWGGRPRAFCGPEDAVVSRSRSGSPAGWGERGLAVPGPCQDGNGAESANSGLKSPASAVPFLTSLFAAFDCCYLAILLNPFIAFSSSLIFYSLLRSATWPLVIRARPLDTLVVIFSPYDIPIIVLLHLACSLTTAGTATTLL